MKRQAGVLMPLSSLPGTLGIGDLGLDAYKWVDALEKAKAPLWQILPLNPVGYGNSPYQTYSAFAGDEIYISIEGLYHFLEMEINEPLNVSSRVDYDSVRELKTKYLRDAFEKFEVNEAYNQFIDEATWLDEYARFMSLRKKNGYTAWVEWTDFEVDEVEVSYQKFLQFIFAFQWQQLKNYANERNVKIVGDIPIYLGHDSAEVYFKRDQFHLDQDGRPTLVAGVPPDYFSEDGQLWGNPIYNWELMAKDDYSFWVERLKWNQKLFDVIRIDHFRAFDTYWVIDGKSDSAKNGEWLLGPAHHFFDSMYKQIEDLELVVEDLGDLRPEVLQLRDDYNLMGMQIIQFALKPEEMKRDVTMKENMLVYTGTHDNETLGGWHEQHPLDDQQRISKELSDMGINDDHIIDQICHYTLSLNAAWAILPIQDVMRLDGSTRINSPGTIGSPNWEWKLDSYDDLDEAMTRLNSWIEDTNRN